MLCAFRLAARTGRAPLFASALLMLAGCGLSGNDAVNIVYIGSPDAPFQNGVFLSAPAQQLRAATAEGLVGFDEQGRVVPALADRWIVTDDGLSYIFRLRGGTWPDGSPITAESASAALRQRFAALRGTALGLDLADAQDLRIMARRVVEIRLDRPKPNLLQLLAQPELGLTRNGKGAGPMRLAREGKVAILRPMPPQDLGMAAEEGWSERAMTLRLAALPAKAAVDRFNEGEAEFLLGGRIENFPLASSVGLLRGTIQIDPTTGLFGLAVTRPEGFLASAGNREAVAMAIDREALIEPFGVGGWKPSTRVVGGEVEDDLGTIGERWSGQDMDERRATARARVQAWRAGRESGPRLVVALPTGPGGDLLFDRLADDLGKIGVTLARTSDSRRADLELVDDVARYPRMAWYLNRLNCRVRRAACSIAADARAAEAARAGDATSRAALYAEAEAELTKANVYIPFGAPIRWSLVRGDAFGFAPNAWGWHPLMPMATRPK